MTVASLGMALLAGAILPFQAAANANVGRALGHPFWGAATSLVISLAVMVPMLILVKAPMPNFSNAFHGPWWLWIGGVLGAVAHRGGNIACRPGLREGPCPNCRKSRR